MDPGVFLRIQLFSSECLVKNETEVWNTKVDKCLVLQAFFDQEELPSIFAWGKSWFIFSYVANDSSPTREGTLGK